LAKAKRHGAKSTHFIVEVRDGNLVVSLPNGRFKAAYYKPAGRPHLILRERTKTTTTNCWQKHFRLRLPRRANSGGSCEENRCMGHASIVLVRCPTTGRELSTGVEMDAATFERLPDARR